MPLRILAGVLLALAGLSHADAADDYKVYETALGKIGVRLAPEKPEVMVGEPLSLTLTISNLGDVNLSTAYGGDERSAQSRPDAFKVSAFNELGEALPVKDESSDVSAGARMRSEELAPRAVRSRNLFLPKWIDFVEAGEHRVCCETTLMVTQGTSEEIRRREKPWNDAIEVPVAAEVRINVVPKDEQRMAELIEKLGRAFNGLPAVNMTGMPPSMGDGRDRAGAYLAAIDDPRAIPHFVMAAKGGNYGKRFVAVQALSRFNDDRAVIGILNAIRVEWPELRKHAPTDEIAQGLTENIRHAAAIALGNSPNPTATKFLLGLSNDPSPSVRLAVAQRAARLETQESLDLLRSMSADENEMVRNEAGRLLRERQGN